MKQGKQRLLELIREKQAWRRQEVVLSSGKTSDFYFDGKKVTLDPEGLALMAGLILDQLKPGQVDAIGGPMIGADPIAAAAALLSFQRGWRPPLRAFIVRKQAKEHGLKRAIEGCLQPGDKVAVVEDVLTTGGSIKEAIQRIEEAGARVIKIICLLDRQEGAAANLSGYPIVSLIDRREIRPN